MATSLAQPFTETNMNNVNNSLAAIASLSRMRDGEAASHNNLFLFMNGRRPLGVLFIFVSVFAFGEHEFSKIIRSRGQK